MDNLRERARRYLDGRGLLTAGAELLADFAREVVREREERAASRDIRATESLIIRRAALNEANAEISRLKGELERISVRSDELESFYDEHTLEIARLNRRVEAGERLREAVRGAGHTGEAGLKFCVQCVAAAAWDAAKDPVEGEE